VFCPTCGKSTTGQATGSTGAAAQPALKREETLLEAGGVTVSTARFIVPGQTYAMSGVTSVKSLIDKPSKKGPIILIIIGLLMLFAGSAGPVILGLVIAGLGVAWLISQKPTYIVVLSSASGETKALTSKDGAFVATVIEAVNRAIVARG
jgi:hypothetical protein